MRSRNGRCYAVAQDVVLDAEGRCLLLLEAQNQKAGTQKTKQGATQ